MANTEKEFEFEGHQLPTAELLVESARLVDLARTHAMLMRNEGVELRTLTEMDQLKEMIVKEQQRVESKPPKAITLTKEQEKVMGRAYQWRSQMIRRVDRAFVDDRYNRLKYHRGLLLFRAPERVYEELYLLVQNARTDLKRLASARVDEEFVNLGEDICYELQGHKPPDRNAQREYEEALDMHRYGPPPKAPEAPPKLPPVNDSARALSILKGRLWVQMKILSTLGQLAHSIPKDKDAEKFEAIRRDFVIKLRQTEEDDELITFGRFNVETEPKTAPQKPGATTSAPAPAAAPPAPAAPPPPPKLSVTPGGPTPPPPSDPLKKPPPRAIGLVRPSPTHGNK